MPLFFLAIAAGFLTVLSPCILPVLPVVLGVGATGDKRRPLYVVLGFVGSFSVIGMFLATAGSFLGVSPSALRSVAVALLIVFGAALLFPSLYARASARGAAFLERVGGSWMQRASARRGLVSGLLIGFCLGLVWTPCAGPVLGTVLTFAAAGGNRASTAILLAAYALGAAVPMLAVAYGGQRATSRVKAIGKDAGILNRIFGVLIILVAVAIATGFDTTVQTWLAQFYPTLNLL